MGTKYLKKEFSLLNRLMCLEHLDNNSCQTFQKHLDITKEITLKSIFNGGLSAFTLIPYLQLNLSDLALAGFYKKDTSDSKVNQPDQTRVLLQKVHMLIRFYKDNFPQEFKMSFVAPESYHQDLMNQKALIMEEILNNLAKTHLQKHLFESLSIYFSEIKNYSTETGLTYASLENFEHLIKSVLNIIKTKSSLEVEKHIITELIRMNFNTSHFIDFCLSIMTEDYSKLKLHDTDIDWKTLMFSINSQKSFNSELIDLYKLIDRITTRHIIELKPAGELKKDSNMEQYFKVIFTSRQLLFFFQLMMETGIVISRSRTGIFDFITKHIGTNKIKKLSKGSLQRKFGKTQSSDVKKVKDQLITMINYINYKY